MRRWLAPLGVGALLTLSACGGSGDPLPAAGLEPGERATPPAGSTPAPPPQPDPSPQPKPTPSRTGRIVFSATHDVGLVGPQGVSNVFIMKADGSSLAQVTDNESPHVEHRQPELSRDRARIVFVSSADGGPYWITVTNADGTGERILSDFGGEDAFDPTFHPKSPQVVFVSRCCDIDGVGIYLINVDGSGRTLLTPTATSNDSPAVSPGGGQITFVSHRDGDPEIYVMNRDGSGQRRLTTHPARDFAPVFSPDNRRIAFASERDGRVEVYVMQWDGADLRRVTTAGGGAPSFGPDGRKILFTVSDGIYVINVDGTGRRLLARGRNPVFSPDGRSVAFLARDAAGPAIYAINVDGTGLERLTDPSSELAIYDGPHWK